MMEKLCPFPSRSDSSVRCTTACMFHTPAVGCEVLRALEAVQLIAGHLGQLVNEPMDYELEAEL